MAIFHLGSLVVMVGSLARQVRARCSFPFLYLISSTSWRSCEWRTKSSDNLNHHRRDISFGRRNPVAIASSRAAHIYHFRETTTPGIRLPHASPAEVQLPGSSNIGKLWW